MMQSLKLALAAALTIAATQAGAAPSFDCVAQYFGPLQPVVTAICKLGS